jgi:hypothetical protein
MSPVATVFRRNVGKVAMPAASVVALSVIGVLHRVIDTVMSVPASVVTVFEPRS